MYKLRKSHPTISLLNNMLIDLPVPSNISHMWNFGSLLGFCLMIQIGTGIFLAMHYVSDLTISFDSISHIMRDVPKGWEMRLIHANGASLFFVAIYLHVGRGLYYNSFILRHTWMTGVIILLLVMATAFLGYVLPWGQMSFWGATVITNLLSAIPYIGSSIVNWVWGGFSVNNATLTRFFSLHFMLPWIILGFVIIHLILLHNDKSNNPSGIRVSCDKIPFSPYFIWKDLFSASVIFSVFMMINFISPWLLMDPENFIPANPLSTPVHIQPEWYFLFAYAILRSIPNKLGGVIALFLSILILIPLMFNKTTVLYNKYKLKPLSYWIFIVNFIMLTWLGMMPVEDPYVMMAQVSTMLYFSIMLLWMM